MGPPCSDPWESHLIRRHTLEGDRSQLLNEQDATGRARAFTLEKTPCYDEFGGPAPAEAGWRLMAGKRTRVCVWLGPWRRPQWVLQTESA